jgi:hypothetical protein
MTMKAIPRLCFIHICRRRREESLTDLKLETRYLVFYNQ